MSSIRTYAELHPKKQKAKLKKLMQESKEQFIDDEKTIQLCLGCNITIKKIGGCNYMRCTNCKTKFCWVCHKIKFITSGCNDKTHNSH
jgi:hypothetical protein